MNKKLVLPKAVKDPKTWGIYDMGEFLITQDWSTRKWSVSTELGTFFKADTFEDAKAFVRHNVTHDYLQEKYPRFPL